MTLGEINHNTRRGTARPETAEEKRRRLHREAADDVKAYARALKEAKQRYRDYDASMAEATIAQLPEGKDDTNA